MKLDSDIKKAEIESENKLASVVAMFKLFLEQYMSLELLRSKNSADLEHIHKNCLSTAETLKKVEEMFMFNRSTEKKPSVGPSNPFISSSGAPMAEAVRDLELRQAQEERTIKDIQATSQPEPVYQPMPPMPPMPQMPSFPGWPDTQQTVNDKAVIEMQNYKRTISEYAVNIASDLNLIQSKIWEQHIAVNKQLADTAQALSELRLKLNELHKL
jgi:hypothetical protein